MTRRIGWSHKVHDAVRGIDIEVEVDFAATHVRVRGHRVPVASRREQGETHHQLAALDSVAIDRLINRSLVAGLEAAEFESLQIRELHHRGRILRVRGIAEEIEVSGILCVLAGEGNGPVAATNVEAIELVQIEALAVDEYRSSAADVEDPKLSPLEEVLCAQFGFGL